MRDSGDLLAKRIVEIDNDLDQLEKKIEQLKADRRAVEQDLLESWAISGVQSLRVDNKTVYVRTEWVGSPAEQNKDRMFKALEDAGFGSIISTRKEVNYRVMQSFLNGFVNEASDVELPTPELAMAINVSKKVSVRTVKS